MNQRGMTSMMRLPPLLHNLIQLIGTLPVLLGAAAHFLGLCLRAPTALAAENLFLRVLKTPPRSPQANAICERVFGTLRRECLDFVIPLTENHLRRLLQEWVRHYNAGRPHMSLGPGMPQPPASRPVPLQIPRHRLPAHLHVVARPILGGLHHEYQLEVKAA